MPNIGSYFVTRIYHAQLSELGEAPSPEELENACYTVAEDDEAGQQYCDEEGYPGYTSYSSIEDLPARIPAFDDLVQLLDKHAEAFIKDCEFDLNGKEIKLENIWINILPEGGIHTSHIHPHSVISGTTYVSVKKGVNSIKYEDPRHAMMMGSPNRKMEAREELKSFIYIQPEIGDVLLWESWLRHEVPMNMAEEDRVSISFNYSWV